MSNPNILLEETKISIISAEKPHKCVCCLSNSGPFVNLTNCSHTTFLESFFKFHDFHSNLVCSLCHSLLKKITSFQQQVITSSTILKEEFHNVESSHPRLVHSALEIFSTDSAPLEEVANIKTETQPSEALTYIPAKETTHQSEEFLIKLERDSSRECSPDTDIPLADLKWSKDNERAPSERLGQIAIEPAAIDNLYKMVDSIKSEKESIEGSSSAADTPLADIQRNKRNNIFVPKKIPIPNQYLETRPEEETKKGYSGKILTIKLNEKEIEDERERNRALPVFLERMYKCTKCIIGFDQEPYLLEHNSKRHAEIPNGHTCEICESVFAKRDSLVAHMKRHNTRYECVGCGLRRIHYLSMTTHYDSIHEDTITNTYKCNQCEFTTDSNSALRYHRTKHRARPVCAECGISFSSNSSLKAHMFYVHKHSSTIFSCNLCSKEFKSRNTLLTHRKSHHTDGVYYCESCNIFFKSHVTYRHHLKYSPKHITEDKRFTCDQCGLKYITKKHLQKHIECVHSDGTPENKCDECDKIFKDKRKLKYHKTYVHEKKPQPRSKICDHCGKGFTTTEILASHIRTHTGERPFICTYCNATFAHKAALYTHTKLLHKRTKK